MDIGYMSAVIAATLGDAGKDRMPVRVDHAGHQCPSTAVDHIRIGDRLGASDQRLDHVALDQHVLVFDKLAACSVEDTHVREQDRL